MIGVSAQPAGPAGPAGPTQPAGPTHFSTLRFGRDPLRLLARYQRIYGDVFTVELTYAGRVVIVTEPDAVRSLLAADPAHAEAGRGRRAMLPLASPHSVFGGNGAEYEQAHARLAEAFSAERISSHEDAIAAIADRHFAGWPRRRPVLLLSRMRTLVAEVFVRLLLGVEDEQRVHRIVDALGAMLRMPGNPPLPPPAPEQGLVGAAVNLIFKRRRDALRTELTAEIEARRGRSTPRGCAAATREAPDAQRPPADMIDSLLAAQPSLGTERVLEEIETMLMAAQEPPSIALTWLLDVLARHPRLAADYLEAGPESSLRAAVLAESLRLRPSALAVVRRLREPMRIGDYELPSGTNTMVPLPLIHRDPRSFEQPERFRPQRWLERGQPPALFLPFGGGARRCIGEPLARAEVKLIVPHALRALSLRPLEPRRERMVLRATVLVPEHSSPMIVRDHGQQPDGTGAA